MIWPIGLRAVLADIVILLALAAAVARLRMPRRAQPLVATLAFACAWIVEREFARYVALCERKQRELVLPAALGAHRP